MKKTIDYGYLHVMYGQEKPRQGWKFLLVVIIFTIISTVLYAGVAGASPLKVSPHFTQRELSCHHCGNCKLNIQLIIALEKLRALANAPIIIASGYRCPLHNREVGGAKHSQHQYGNAVDIKIKGYTPAQVAAMAKKCGFTWEKVYSNRTHIDVRQIQLARSK